MNRILIIHIMIFCSIQYNSQVSIGNSNIPNSSVILDLTNSSNKGLLLPSKTNTLPIGPTGITIFNPDNDMIFYSKDGSNLNALSTWNFNPYNDNNISYNLGGNVGIGNSSPNVKLSISGGSDASKLFGDGFMLIGSSDNNHLLFDDDEIMSKSNANTGSTLNLQIQGGEGVNVNGSIKQRGDDYIPSGTIVMWEGSISGNYPLVNGVQNTEWYVCNGTNGTPDLRDRFIVGAGSSYSLNANGGANTSNHTHDVNFGNITSSNTSHTHSLSSTSSTTTIDKRCGCYDPWVARSSHTHSAGGGSHNHDINIANYTSTSQSFNNRPLYYSLYFIMKK